MVKHLVAIGDSFTVGIGDEVEGVALKSWVEHFAQLHTPTLKYTNLAKRGLITKEIREQQLDEAVRIKPNLVSIVAGANDILKGRWDRKVYEEEMKLMVETLSMTGATIILGNLPDFTVRLPISLEQKQIIKEQLLVANEIIQSLSNEYDLFHVNLWSHTIAGDNKFWSKDMVHPNALGYREIAGVFFNLFSKEKDSSVL